MSEIASAIGDAPFVLVLDDRDVVLGKVLARSIDAVDGDDPARDHLIEGPTSVRADEDVEALTQRMERADTSSVIVTTPEGRLLGVYFRRTD
ncbi:MAG: hypothetical protein R3320_08320 [Nitriliruptorales bacterium]|nr:hypothetical protein [Nitriliruptorales bacterium]